MSDITASRRPILSLKKRPAADVAPALLALDRAPAPPPTPDPAPPAALAHVAPEPFDMHELLATLAPLFELAEGERMLTRYPYAIGIVDALLTDPRYRGGEEGRELVQRTVMRVVRSHPYTKAMTQPGAMRHDVNGQPVEAVSESHRAHALARIEKRRRQRLTDSTVPAGCPAIQRR